MLQKNNGLSHFLKNEAAKQWNNFEELELKFRNKYLNENVKPQVLLSLKWSWVGSLSYMIQGQEMLQGKKKGEDTKLG